MYHLNGSESNHKFLYLSGGARRFFYIKPRPAFGVHVHNCLMALMINSFATLSGLLVSLL